MKAFKLMESTYAANYELHLSEVTGGTVRFPREAVDKFLAVMFMSMADYAKKLRNKEQAVAVAIDDEKGNILFWLKLEYLKGSKDDPDGSWNPTWGFEKEEIADTTVYRTSNNNDLISTTITRARAAYNMVFDEVALISTAYRCMATVLRSWLEANADPTEEVALVYDDYFKAAVQVVDDVNVLTFSSEEELTNLMKGDSELQVNP